jgi:CheY-like chemotaxis protein
VSNHSYQQRSFVPSELAAIGLPDIDGYEVARTIRADSTLASVVLVAVTGAEPPVRAGGGDALPGALVERLGRTLGS